MKPRRTWGRTQPHSQVLMNSGVWGDWALLPWSLEHVLDIECLSDDSLFVSFSWRTAKCAEMLLVRVFFYDCLQADGMVIHCILFCVWRCSGFVQTFSTFFFHLLPLPRNMSSLSSPHCRGHWKSLFANEACKDGEWAGCAEKHVPECFSPTQPGWKEKLSTPQAACTAPALSFPPPYFKFHNWESRA